jgi:hypothetical protein
MHNPPTQKTRVFCYLPLIYHQKQPHKKRKEKYNMLKETISISKKAEGGLLCDIVSHLRNCGATISSIGYTKNRAVVIVEATENEDRIATILGHYEYDGLIHIRNSAKFEKKYEHLW